MKAWQIHTLGAPKDALVLDELAVPTPGPSQVVVKVLAAAANFADTLLCKGEYQMRPELPFTPGIEMCGEITGVGSDVARWRVGDRVLGIPEFPRGGFAEYAVLDGNAILPAPDTLDDAEAASLLVGYQTGWVGLVRRAALRPGETLLVHAAAGGVGSAAVQLGNALGATVIGVAGGPSKADFVRQLGADVVVDRRSESFVDVVKEVTGGRGADVIYDPVGGDTYDQSTKCVAFEGRILVVGFAGGRIEAPALNHCLVKNYSIVGLHWGLYAQRNPGVILECHEELRRLAAEGRIKPFVSERLCLADVPDGLTRLATGETVGRLVFLP